MDSELAIRVIATVGLLSLLGMLVAFLFDQSDPDLNWPKRVAVACTITLVLCSFTMALLLVWSF